MILGRAERVTYNEVYQKSCSVSEWIKQSIGEDQRIILISENSSFFIQVYLGIMKSGNVCVPLNPEIEENNLEYIIQNTGSTHLFISHRLRGKFDLGDLEVFEEKDIMSIGNRHVSTSQNEFDDRKKPAQILFTSGSTGNPKGVMLSHRNLISNTESIVEYLKLGKDDIIEIVLPFHYCYGLSLLHTHLRVGGSIVLNNSFIFLGSVFDDLLKFKCTGFAGVPSHFQILLRKSQSFKRLKFPDLRYVTQAGGKLHKAFIEEFTGYFPTIDFYVMYGQTEATARLSYLSPAHLKDKLGSIGKAIPGVILDILNESGQPVKVGETGELVAKGDNVMLGYLNDGRANRQVLKNGWLFTGDMAKRDSQGFIYLVARKKEIIKVGGKRISPKEIEEVIVNIPEVINCHVEAAEDSLLGESVRAIVVVNTTEDLESCREKILRECHKKLASFKIPRIIEFTDKIQLNATGKKLNAQL
jgi:acyl-CoA synthetase (AMP-forming)/AMP-acid ligase II